MSSVGPTTRVRTSDDVHVREFDGEMVLLDVRTGDYFGVNEVGARVWSALSDGRSIAEVVDALVAQYAVDRARLLADVIALTTDFVARRLVTVEEASP